MARLTFLNKKKVKDIYNILDRQWSLKKGFEKDLDYVFMMNSKNKIYVINNEITKVDFDILRIDNMGLYFGELKAGDMKNGEIRLSIEGSQIVGPFATKNVVEISDGLKRLWVRGYDLEVNVSGKGKIAKTADNLDVKKNPFVIVKNKDDSLGCGRLKEGKVLNHVPKSRRVRSED